MLTPRRLRAALALSFVLLACTTSITGRDTPDPSAPSLPDELSPTAAIAAPPEVQAPSAELETQTKPSETRFAVDPKPVGEQVRRGLQWLVAHQLQEGGWGQGDESPNMGSTSAMSGVANVADTSVAVIALLRSGSSPASGEYAGPIHRGIDYIVKEIEESSGDSLYITDVRGTRVQGKIGAYVDTFAALMVLTEVDGKMPDAVANGRVSAALDKVLAKVEKNQQADGSWGDQGWAVALSQSMATKGLNQAAATGRAVNDTTLERAEAYSANGYDARSKAFSAGDAAGIGLYAGAAKTSAMKSSVATRRMKKPGLDQKLATAKNAGERQAVQQQLDATKAAETQTQAMEEGLLAQLKNPAFVQGFGNNGGEEFLSYLLVSETLVVDGGDRWKEWDRTVTALVNAVQNGDGSWTGHHCITGRTFCTAAALMVLLADRTPISTTTRLRG